jgi:hypothetical protein
MDETVEVGLSALVELAIDGWRLQRWALARGFEKDRVVARQAARTLTSFLDGLGFETCDLVGQPYDPGLAVDVVDSEEDAGAPAESVRIEVMLAPIVLRNGRLIRAGQVAVRRGAPAEEVGG